MNNRFDELRSQILYESNDKKVSMYNINEKFDRKEIDKRRWERAAHSAVRQLNIPDPKDLRSDMEKAIAGEQPSKYSSLAYSMEREIEDVKKYMISLNNIIKESKEDIAKYSEHDKPFAKSNLEEAKRYLSGYTQYLSYLKVWHNKQKRIEEMEDNKKSKRGFFKKKLTKESANEFKLEVYESWGIGLLTDDEKDFMINYINESVED